MTEQTKMVEVDKELLFLFLTVLQKINLNVMSQTFENDAAIFAKAKNQLITILELESKK